MPAEWETTQALLRRLRWAVRRPIAHRPNGDERSRRAGPGVEFAHVREYQPGDDVRRIDWLLTARSDRAYVREAYDERGIDVWLVVDASPSIDWGTALGLKRDLAVGLAQVACQLLGRRGNRVGLIQFAEKPFGIVPPGTGPAHLDRIVGRLRHEPRRPAAGPTDIAEAMSATHRVARRPSVIVLVSDFLAPGSWSERLRLLTRRHEVIAVRLRDPREAALPDVGLVTFEDPETGDQFSVDTRSEDLRTRFQQAAALQAQRIDGTLQQCGAEMVVVGTDELLMPRLAGFLDARHRLRSVVPRAAGAWPTPDGRSVA